jgi:hypothetical protein
VCVCVCDLAMCVAQLYAALMDFDATNRLLITGTPLQVRAWCVCACVHARVYV